MRSYAEPIIAHPDPAPHEHLLQGHGSVLTAEEDQPAPPKAFLWRGRHYSVRTVVATWLDQAPWWRSASAPVRRCWRVEAIAGMASGVSLVDLSCDAGGSWQLVAVHD